MEQGQLNWVANFIWGIADDVLRDLYVRGKYRDVILDEIGSDHRGRRFAIIIDEAHSSQGVLKDDTELFKQFMDNEGFRRWLTDTVFGITYGPSPG
jgi:hypothetical protein